MAFRTTSRTTGSAFTARPSGGRVAPAGSPSARTTGGNLPSADSSARKNAWTSITALYDSYHSSLDLQIVADLYKTSFCLKMAPVFSQRRGPDDGGSGKKYDHENAAMVVLELPEAIRFARQLAAVIAGSLYEFTIARLETKRLVVSRAEVYYEEGTEDGAIHSGGIVFSIEEDASERGQGRNVVFISRPQLIKLADWEVPPTDENPDGVPAAEEVYWPEAEAVMACVESFIQNVARVDFASTRLLNNISRRSEETNDTAAPMPTRRAGLGSGTAPVTRPAANVVRPNNTVTRSAATQTNDENDHSVSNDSTGNVPGLDDASVSDSDLDDLLGGDNKF